ncbi:hypothetical protein PT274_00830 [Leuconostocaceae bacterium ESL0958]|nr:hypothetical protein [Leuconostocaceae bacterium ESL0958]
MKAINIPAQDLMKVIAGQNVAANEQIRGEFLLVAASNDHDQLPSAMAGAIADIALGQVQLQALVHPLRIDVDQPLWTAYTVEDDFIKKERHNWFGPEALVIEKRFADFLKDYQGPRDTDGRVPASAVPKEIAEPLLLSDAYWQAYANFVNDPDGRFKAQIKPIFSRQS